MEKFVECMNVVFVSIVKGMGLCGVVVVLVMFSDDFLKEGVLYVV